MPPSETAAAHEKQHQIYKKLAEYASVDTEMIPEVARARVWEREQAAALRTEIAVDVALLLCQLARDEESRASLVVAGAAGAFLNLVDRRGFPAGVAQSALRALCMLAIDRDSTIETASGRQVTAAALAASAAVDDEVRQQVRALVRKRLRALLRLGSEDGEGGGTQSESPADGEMGPQSQANQIVRSPSDLAVIFAEALEGDDDPSSQSKRAGRSSAANALHGTQSADLDESGSSVGGGRSSSLVGARPSLQSAKDDGKVSSGAVAALIAVMGAGEGQLDEAFEAHFQAAVDSPVLAMFDGVSSETEPAGSVPPRARGRLDEPSMTSMGASRLSLHPSTSSSEMQGIASDAQAVACLPACWWRVMDPAGWQWSVPSPALLARTESRLAGLPLVLNGYAHFMGYYTLPRSSSDNSSSVGVALDACPRSLLRAAAAIGASALRRRGASLRIFSLLVTRARKATQRQERKPRTALEMQMRSRSEQNSSSFPAMGHASKGWAVVPAIIRLRESMPIFQTIEEELPHACSTERSALSFGGGVDFRKHICGEGLRTGHGDTNGEALGSAPGVLRRDMSRSSGLEEAHMISADVPGRPDEAFDGQHLMRSAMAEAEALNQKRWDAVE